MQCARVRREFARLSRRGDWRHDALGAGGELDKAVEHVLRAWGHVTEKPLCLNPSPPPGPAVPEAVAPDLSPPGPPRPPPPASLSGHIRASVLVYWRSSPGG